MAVVKPIWNAFNAGELSPMLEGRTDQEKYFTGAKRMENFIPTVQGPAKRRGGTRLIGRTKNDAKVWFLTFEYSAEQSYVLELGHLYMRFWVNRGQLINVGEPFEIVTPWTSAMLTTSEGTCAIRTTQSGDVMWMTHVTGDTPPYKLRRFGATSWTLTTIPFDSGPFQAVDPTSANLVCPSNSSGVVTLTSMTDPIFLPAYVGTTFYMETQNPSLVSPWKPGEAMSVGAYRRYEGNVYEALNAATTGASPPVHLSGKGSDGAVDWLYIHSGYGWSVITAVAGDAMTATATVVSRYPDEVLSATKTNRWAFGEFNSIQGWPTVSTFFRERLVYGRRRLLAFSVVGSYDDFRPLDGPDVTKETAIKLQLAVDRIDAIRWLAGTGKALLVGSPRSEIVVQEQTTQQVFAADNVTVQPQTSYGAALVEPVAVESAVLFPQRARRVLREMKYSYEVDRYKADDLNVLSDHILDDGLIDMDFALEPDSVLWGVRADGRLVAMTYNRERGVIAWVPHPLGGDGIVEAVAVIPHPNGRRDDVWLSVARSVGGQVVRSVEIIEDERLVETSVADGFFVDCGLTYSGAPATTISGLGHAEGRVVQVLADGSAHEDITVTGGAITLARPASKVQVGYKMTSTLIPMRPEAGAQNGSGQARFRRTYDVALRLFQTIGGKVGPSLNKLQEISGLNPALAVGAVPELFTGDRHVPIPAKWDKDGFMCVVQDQPFPMTVVAIIPEQAVND